MGPSARLGYLFCCLILSSILSFLFLDIPPYSLDKLCNYWSEIFEIFSKYAVKILCFVCAMFYFFIEMLFRRY